jgi:(p)ppGpp synthase/HD superfamily hydrolase
MTCFSDTLKNGKKHIAWTDHLKRIHRETKEKSSAYLEALSHDILKGFITLHTSDHKILYVPIESSALDAAFYCLRKDAQYVSEILVNGKKTNFSTFLRDGDSIVFVRDTTQKLTPEWLDQVNTSYSKSFIYDIVQSMKGAQKISFGEKILQRELEKRSFGYMEEIKDNTIENLFHDFGIKTIHSLC